MKKITSTFLAILFACTLFLGYAPTAKAAAAADYHAFMGIQTNPTLWIFRNAYDEPNYGYGKDAFKGLSSTKDGVVTSHAGTFTDADITGDGTYTVALDNPDFSTETKMSQLFVSTDIPMCESIKVTDVIVKIDGKTVYTFDKGALNPDSYKYVQIMCQNIWNPDVTDLFSSALPFSKCEITFTISGIEKATAMKEALKDFDFNFTKDHAIIKSYTGSNSTLTIPSTAYGKPVTEIYMNAFQNLPIKEVVIPSSITLIGKYAFAGTKLTSVTIPKSVTSIKDGAFSSCTGLKKITVAKGNSSYAVKDGVLFSKDLKTLVCYSAGLGTTYTIPSSVTAIQNNAFESCSKLTKLTISKKVATIGKDVFKGCTKLTIYAPSGSAAYTYATKNGIKVKKS